MKKIPMRSCVGCRQTRPKKELVRIVRTPQSDILLDPRGKMSGRGAYVCRNRDCLARAIKTRALERALGQEIPDNVIASLATELEKGEDETRG